MQKTMHGIVRAIEHEPFRLGGTVLRAQQRAVIEIDEGRLPNQELCVYLGGDPDPTAWYGRDVTVTVEVEGE